MSTRIDMEYYPGLFTQTYSEVIVMVYFFFTWPALFLLNFYTNKKNPKLFTKLWILSYIPLIILWIIVMPNITIKFLASIY